MELETSKSYTGTARTPGADHRLLLQRLEELLQRDPESSRAMELLRQESIWQRLDAAAALRWAQLAQAAGLVEVSLQVLTWLNNAQPDFTPAWKERVELLATLGQRPGDTGLTTPFGLEARGESPGPPDASHEMPESGHSSLEVDPEDLDAPFFGMRPREALLARYLEIFQGREDCFARQWADRKAGTQGYTPVRRPLEAADVWDHVRGHRTYGIYILQRDSRVRLAVVDADLVARLRSAEVNSKDREQLRREQQYLIQRLPEVGRSRGLPCLTEFSGGKGYHFWYLFAQPVAAGLARQAIQGLVRQLEPDLTCFRLEVFPKQDQLSGKGLGNLVKLPLGIHRGTGKQSHLVGFHDRSPMAQLAALKTLERIPPEALTSLTEPVAGQVLVHPRQEQWAREYPELALLAERCPAIGQILAGCRQSHTLSIREEKVLLGTIGFLQRSKVLLHHIFQQLPEYNPHLLDFKHSRLRGTPLGCKRIHGLLELHLDLCRFQRTGAYAHPLLHWPEWSEDMAANKAEHITNLADAIQNLKQALDVMERFLPHGPQGD